MSRSRGQAQARPAPPDFGRLVRPRAAVLLTAGLEGRAFLAAGSGLVGGRAAASIPRWAGVLRGLRARADQRVPAGISGTMVGVGIGVAFRS